MQPGGIHSPEAARSGGTVAGGTLADRIKRGALPLREALELARQIAEALDHLHERAVVYRGLTPAAIHITPAPAITVPDVELALPIGAPSAADRDPSQSPTSLGGDQCTGSAPAAAPYLSPEQLRGRAVDRRADIWAFGCVLYEMLTGAAAFRGESDSDTIAAVLEREPDMSRLPPATPGAICLLLRRCLQKDVKRRLRDIGDARMDLEEALALPSLADVSRGARSGSWRLSRKALSLTVVCFAMAGGAGWMAAQRRTSDSVPAIDRMVRLVSTRAHEFSPAISPDGKWVAYLSNARGPTDVWVKFIAGGDPANLTASANIVVQTADNIGGLAVSPDGSQIAFQAQASAGLGSTWVIPAPLGGVPHRLLPPGRSGVQWSPDGRRIAYVDTGGPLGDAVLVADADGQHEVEILKRQGALHAHWVRWDAAGKFVYFNHGIPNNQEPNEVFRAPADGGPAERVVATVRRAVAPFPAPDGRGLFYAANPDGADLGLWWRDQPGRRVVRLTTGIGDYSAPSVSADGRRMVGTVLDIRQSLERLVVAVDRPPVLEPLTDGFSGDIDPSESPDGTRIAFSSARAGHRTLWTARADLTQPAPLTTGAALDERPVFSPDGQQVAFVSDRGGRRGIWLVSADAGAPRPVIAADVQAGISWSPDGRRLAYSAAVGDVPGLITVDVATGQTARIPTAEAAVAPAWSPNRDVIAYIEPRRDPPVALLKFVSSAGQAITIRPEAVLNEPLGNGTLAWSPDGRRLAVASWLGSFASTIWIVEPEGREPPRKLVTLPSGFYVRGLAWRRDGSSLIVGRVQAAGDIFLAELRGTP